MVVVAVVVAKSVHETVAAAAVAAARALELALAVATDLVFQNPRLPLQNLTKLLLLTPPLTLF